MRATMSPATLCTWVLAMPIEPIFLLTVPSMPISSSCLRLMPTSTVPSMATDDVLLTALEPPRISKDTFSPPNASLIALATEASASR